MKALTLHRPWSSYIAIGEKRIENRGWAPPPALLGVEFAVHAGKAFDTEGAAFCRKVVGERREILEHVEGVIATVRLVGWVDRSGKVMRRLTSEPEDLGLTARDREWLFGPIGWVLREARPLSKPVEARGLQKLWNLDEASERLVLERRAPIVVAPVRGEFTL